MLFHITSHLLSSDQPTYYLQTKNHPETQGPCCLKSPWNPLSLFSLKPLPSSFTVAIIWCHFTYTVYSLLFLNYLPVTSLPLSNPAHCSLPAFTDAIPLMRNACPSLFCPASQILFSFQDLAQLLACGHPPLPVNSQRNYRLYSITEYLCKYYPMDYYYFTGFSPTSSKINCEILQARYYVLHLFQLSQDFHLWEH